MNSKNNIPSESELLNRAQGYFEKNFMKRQKDSIQKLKLDDIKFNPFLIRELASRISNQIDSISIAKAMVFPRVLGTSASTSFGSNTQNMIVSIMGQDVSSNVSDMDIEYQSPVTGDYRWAQLKAGPSTINKSDIETIERGFQKAQNLARQNQNKRFTFNSSICAVMYGSRDQLSNVYKTMEKNGYVNILVGNEFWYDLTGYPDFYINLITAVEKAAQSISLKDSVDDAIDRIAKEIYSRKSEFNITK